MWRFIKSFWDVLVLASTWVGIFYLWADLAALPDQYGYSWGRVMPDRETALAIFSGALILYLLWIDARPFIYERWGRKRRIESFERPDFWSVSFDSGRSFRPLTTPPLGGDCHTIRLEGLTIQNLSKSQHRFFDARLLVKFPSDRSALMLEPREIGLLDNAATFPLELRPNQSLRIDVEFEIEPEDRDKFTLDFIYTMDFEDNELIMIESVSGKHRSIHIGEFYDALTNKLRIRRSSESKAERLKLRGIGARKQP